MRVTVEAEERGWCTMSRWTLKGAAKLIPVESGSLSTEDYLCAEWTFLRLRLMEFWTAAILFLIVIACLCVIVHWQAKRRRTKS